MDFNSHAHVERDGCGQAKGTNEKNFNSHAHVERDERKIWAMQVWCISTHTLTWSVTCWNFWAVQSVDDFNSHAHVERDG